MSSATKGQTILILLETTGEIIKNKQIGNISFVTLNNCTYPNDHVSFALSLKRDLCYFLYAMYFGYQMNLYI